MALIYQAELHPTKLDLLAGWLPERRWYDGPTAPELTRVSGYRFDDPAGEVGMETLLVSVGDETIYQVPLTYRGAPLPGGDAWLIGTTEHSVLGRRWVYDACGDPVYAATLASVLFGAAGQAEEFVDVDGRPERREPAMSVSATSSANADVPAVEVVRGVMDADPTTILTDPVVLVVVRALLLTMPPPSAALTATWHGQPDAVTLAYGYRR